MVCGFIFIDLFILFLIRTSDFRYYYGIFIETSILKVTLSQLYGQDLTYILIPSSRLK